MRSPVLTHRVSKKLYRKQKDQSRLDCVRDYKPRLSHLRQLRWSDLEELEPEPTRDTSCRLRSQDRYSHPRRQGQADWSQESRLRDKTRDLQNDLYAEARSELRCQ